MKLQTIWSPDTSALTLNCKIAFQAFTTEGSTYYETNNISVQLSCNIDTQHCGFVVL